MKYIYLSIFVSLLIATAMGENTSFLKQVTKVNASVAIASSEVEEKSHQGYCFMKMKNNFYDLHPFNVIKPWKIIDITGKIIKFNFCSNVDTKCRPDDALMAETESCRQFAGRSDQEKTWVLSSDIFKNDVITLTLPKGDTCKDGKYETTVELTCDLKLKVPVITNNRTFDQTKCNNIIKFRARQACSSGRFSAWWNQFGIPKETLAGILIAIGLYFIIGGVYCWKLNSIIINCAILGLILFSFLSLFIKINLGVCMLIGVAIAFIAFSFPAFNAVILGIVVGYLFGSLLYNLLVKVVPVNPQALYWSTLIICILFVSIAGGFMESYMVCLATSLVGSYALVRGVSIYAGGYPDETYVMRLINEGEYTQFGRVFGPKIYLYIGGIFFLTAIGFWIQTYMVPKNPDEEKKDVPKTDEVNKTEEKKEIKIEDDTNKTTSAQTENHQTEKKVEDNQEKNK